ncbi:hypothetical protein YC2023_067432 [Brassica napus]
MNTDFQIDIITVMDPWRVSIDQQEKFRVVDLNLEVQTDLYIGLPERHCK